MDKGRPMRAVVAFDIELDGGFDLAAEFSAELKKFAMAFVDQHEKGGSKANSDIGKSVKFVQTQAELLLTERRGLTGPLNNIVFRGTRGPNSSNNEMQDVLAQLKLPTFNDGLHKTRTMQVVRLGVRGGLSVEQIQEKLDKSDAKYRANMAYKSGEY